MNNYFDEIYVLNLKRRSDRLKLSEKRLQFTEIEKYTVFNAVDGSVMTRIWKSFNQENSYFKNSSYLACAISHLSIYKDALEKGHSKILILEDDNRIHYKVNEIFNNKKDSIPEWDLLYLGFIPLTDDQTCWDYNVLANNFLPNGIVKAKNLWGLYAYGISQNLMKEMIKTYNQNFPMEIDRYFVNFIQPKGKSFGILPQLFAADDGYSDNSMKIESGMMQRSIDGRFAKLTDYV